MGAHGTWGQFFRLCNKAKPSAVPLVVLLDEVDLLVDDIIEGKIQISEACPMAIEMMSKKGFNHFLVHLIAACINMS
jgi:hypothetical protein